MRRAFFAVVGIAAWPVLGYAQQPAGPLPPVQNLAELPPLPPVEDPMLAPVPPPRRVLTSWSEAYQLLQARSTNLKTAVDQVIEAEGQTIVAFAQYLPAFGGCAGGSSAPPGCINGTLTHQLLTRPATENVPGEPAGPTSACPEMPIFKANCAPWGTHWRARSPRSNW